MKVAFLRYQTWPTGNAPPIKGVIAKAMENKPDLIVGPEYLLKAPKGKDAFNKGQKKLIFRLLADMTAGTSTVIVPGTLIWGEACPG